MINSFSGEYTFLSNFYPVQIEYEGIIYPTSEHAFQAAKSLDKTERFRISKLETPGQAKRAGRKTTLQPDWEDIKIDVMREILLVKFADPVLAEKLIATEAQMLIEGNDWGDAFWGVCNNKGENHLGKLLMMDVRGKCRREFPDIAAKYPLVVDCDNLSWAGLDGSEDPIDIALHVGALTDYLRSQQDY